MSFRQWKGLRNQREWIHNISVGWYNCVGSAKLHWPCGCHAVITRTGYGLSLILAVHSHGEWMQRNVRIIYIKVNVELWCPQALSCPAYSNLSFFLTYRVSITDISSQIHVLTLKNKNKPRFSSFFNLLSCFHTFPPSVHLLLLFKCQSNSYSAICLFWIINEDNK